MQILSHIDSNLGVITLNDSANGNRLNALMLTDLLNVLKNLQSDLSVRAILLRSNGIHFCLGMDFSAVLKEKSNAAYAEKAASLYQEVLAALLESPKPVIALINGEVKAGGIGIIAACDINIASDSSTFELSEVFFGLIPANVLPYLIYNRMSFQKARYLSMTARKISAAEALNLNLVDEVYPAENLEAAVKNLLKNLYRTSPSAIAELKAFTRSLIDSSFNEATALSKEKLIQMVSDPAVIKGIEAFSGGEIPEWFGKFRPTQPILLYRGEK